MQQGAGVTVEQLLGKNGHPADSAAVDSTAANDSNVLSADESSLSSEPAQVLGFKDNVKKAAQNAADGAAHLKDSVANKLRGSESKTAAVATVHTTAVTSSDAVGGIFPPSSPLHPSCIASTPPPCIVSPFIFRRTPTSFLCCPQCPSSGLTSQSCCSNCFCNCFFDSFPKSIALSVSPH